MDDDVFWTSKDLLAGSVKGNVHTVVMSMLMSRLDTNMTLAKNEPDGCFLLWLLLRFPVQVVASC